MRQRASHSTASMRTRPSALLPVSPASTPISPTPTAGRIHSPALVNSRERIMRADVRHELEELVEEVRALVVRLKRHDQPFATQLLEMAVIELKSRMHNIGDEEFEALVDSRAGEAAPEKAVVKFTETGEPHGLPALT